MAKENIVILHGWSKHKSRLKPLINALEEKRYGVFCPTLPGFGKERFLDKPWKIDDYVDWLESYIEARKIKNCILVGYSNGGRIILHLAQRNPLWLKSIVLINSAGIKKNLKLKQIIFLLLAKTGKLVFKLPILKHARKKVRRVLYTAAREKDYYEAHKNLAKTMINLLKYDAVPTLQAIKVPALLLWGAKDQTTPLADALIMKEILTKRELVIFPSAAHALPYDYPEEVTKEIVAFCKQ